MVFWLSLLSLCLTLAVTVAVGLGMKRMRHIGDIPPSTKSRKRGEIG